MTPLPQRLRHCLLALLLASTTAVAHSPLRDSQPANGAQLTQAPETVELTFNKPAMLTALSLRIAGVDTALSFERGPADTLWSVPVSQSGPGDYTLIWRALSADGHPVRGEIHYTVTP